MTVIDPRLESLYDDTPSAERADITVSVLFEWHGDHGTLTAIGLQLDSTEGGFISAQMPLSLLPRLRELGIEHVEIAKRARPKLDVSRPHVKADMIGPLLGNQPGQGVIIGVVDAGVDYYHPAFLDAQGRSRILFIWDQRLTLRRTVRGKSLYPGESLPRGLAPRFQYGVEFDKAVIDGALASGRRLRSREIWGGHGSHVAGIAAGNGGAPPGQPTGTYTGVATHADLIVVALGDASIWDFSKIRAGVEYIFERARNLDRPCVVNLSLGLPHGARDGTTTEERGLDAFVDDAGRAIVMAVGNEGDLNLHVQGKIGPGQSATFTLDVVAGEPSDHFVVEIWYGLTADSERFDIDVKSPGGQVVSLQAPTQTSSSKTSGRLRSGNAVRIWSRTAFPPTGKNQIVAEISSEWQRNTVEQGRWTFTLQGRTVGTGAPDGVFHAYLEQAVTDPGQSVFSSPNVTPASTVGFPATAKKVISVGSYVTKPLGSPVVISTFSSRGPTIDGRHSPTLTAPGEAIWSALSTNVVLAPGQPPLPNPNTGYVGMQGTSMATPHVAGAVAAMLQAKPGLDTATVMDILSKSARQPPITNPDMWGSGLLDALEAVKRAQALTKLSVSYLVRVPCHVFQQSGPGTSCWLSGGWQAILVADIDIALAGAPSLKVLTRRWSRSYEFKAVDALTVSGRPTWYRELRGGAASLKDQQLAVADSNLRAVWSPPAGGSHGVKFVVAGANPLLPGTEAIDAEIIVGLRIQAGQVQYCIEGRHDGFPDHLLKVDTKRIYQHDCLMAGKGPADLAPPADVQLPAVAWTNL